jgi:kinesin family protein 3/17
MARAFETVFKSIECDPKKQYLVRASYLELYNEEIRDLLSKNGENKLELKEKDNTVYVKDLSTFVVK